MGELDKINSYRREVAVAETIKEVKLLSTKGELLAEMAKKLQIPINGQNELGRTRVELEKKKRELIVKMFPKGRSNQYTAKSKNLTLQNVGITRNESSDAKIIKDEEKLVKEAMNEIEKGNDIITPQKVASKVRKKKKEKDRQNQSEEGSKIKITNKDIDFRLGDFKTMLDDISDGSLDCIITDPPYPIEFIQCWSDLSLFANRKLKENGFCIAYSGQTNLIEVMNRMNKNLFYYWTFALFQTGGNQLINHRNIFCGWKPLLIFQNGFKKQDKPIEDIIKGTGMEKSLHKWQQAELELKPIIEHFTKPGDLICDPFLGSGTTGISAYSLKRKFIGAEIKEQTFNIAKKRINEYIKTTT